jgi:hypothetical protein
MVDLHAHVQQDRGHDFTKQESSEAPDKNGTDFWAILKIRRKRRTHKAQR